MDLGCGSAKLLNFIKKYHFSEYVGLDFDINQLLNYSNAYQLLEDYNARALLYQRLLLTSEIPQKLNLLSFVYLLWKNAKS